MLIKKTLLALVCCLTGITTVTAAELNIHDSPIAKSSQTNNSSINRHSKGKRKKTISANSNPNTASSSYSYHDNIPTNNLDLNNATLTLLQELAAQNAQLMQALIERNNPGPTSSSSSPQSLEDRLEKTLYIPRMDIATANSFLHIAPQKVKDYANIITCPHKRQLAMPSTLLLHGPAGTGKSDLAIALAVVSNLPCHLIEAHEIGNQWQNSGKNALKDLIEPIIKADDHRIIILEEIMRLTERFHDDKSKVEGENNDVTTALWRLIEKCSTTNKIFFIATANSIESLPEQLQSRLQCSKAKIDIPPQAILKEVLNNLLLDHPECSNILKNHIAHQMAGKLAIRDINQLVRTANLYAIRAADSGLIQNGLIPKITDTELIRAFEELEFPDGEFVKFWKENRKEFYKNLLIQSPTLLISATSNIISTTGVASQIISSAAGLNMQEQSLNLQKRANEIAERQLEITEEQVSKPIQNLVENSCATIGSMVGDAVGSVGGPVGGSICAAAGGALGKRVGKTIYQNYCTIL